jgi:F-type H+-transporting ATPase subunit a
LLPGLAAVGVCEEHHVEAEAEHSGLARLAAPLPDASQDEVRPPLGCHAGEVIVPLFRSPSTDLNSNLALALTSVFMTQVFGVMAVGLGYFGKFFNVQSMLRAFRPTPDGQRRGCAGMLFTFVFGGIDFFVSILELVSEFAKIISFSFRLFGNIFAGEVMLVVLASLVPLVLTLPFLGLEVFVGLIQAFIFYILTLAFFSIATVSHGHEEGQH